jgi:PKD repeat protein
VIAIVLCTAVAFAVSGIQSASAQTEYAFVDVTNAAGVADASGVHWGATWSDYDGDGLIDIYVVNGAGQPNDGDDANTLYRNNGDGTFTDVTAATGTGDPWIAMRNIWADYDRDGDLDLYSHNFEQSTLYQNNGNVFTDVNVSSGAGIEMEKGTGAAWGDYDNDGWLDIHATGFPGFNVLLHNNGDGTFTNRQAESGMSFSASGMGNVWGDYDQDGDIDMAITAVTKDDPVFLYINNGDGTFYDGTIERGVIVEDGSSTAAVSWVDYDNDGDWDLHITEVSAGSAKTLPNRMYLFENEGDNTFVDATAAAGMTPPTMSEFWDAAFVDWDSDGDVDMYLAGNGPDVFYENNGDGTFTDIAAEVGIDITDTTWGIVWGDYDNDGDMDAYVVRKQGPSANVLYENQGGSNNWLQLELRGTISNLDAIGAQIIVVANGQTQMREITGGSGFFSQHSLIQHFGLGQSTTIDSIEIRWPSGIVQQVSGLAINDRHVIFESDTGAPVASFTATPGVAPLEVDFDGSASTDDGTIVAYEWDFGDGNTASGQTTTHTFATAGTYTVALTVTDDEGMTGATSQSVTVSDGSNQAPTAAFGAAPSGLAVDFTDQSTDSDGSVVGWDWDFGDGNSSTSQHPSHTYAAAGTYTVTLTVTDDQGASDTTSAGVTVTDSGSGAHVGDLDGSSADDGRGWIATVTVDVHDSAELPVEGVTVEGTWSNGTSGTGTCTTDASGSCSITRDRIRDAQPSVTFTVTAAGAGYDAAANHDADGDSDGTTIVIPQEPATNTPPSAAFASTCTQLDCTFTDTSTDGDGSVVSWSWDFGDGATSTEPNPSHSYAAAGTYSVSLTATDDAGGTDTTTNAVTVTDDGGGATMHIADLDASSISQGSTWLAIATVSVVDDTGAPVAGATVSGTFRRGEVGECTTDDAGVCDVELSTSGRRQQYTVTGIGHGSLIYDAAANTDPDGDSDGTVITINAP